MWEFPPSFGYRFNPGNVDGFGSSDPTKQPWLYQASPYHPWFEHHERGSNRTMYFNCGPTGDEGV
jgi:hypothetical protein